MAALRMAGINGVNGAAPAALVGTGTRVNATAVTASTAEAAVPAAGALTRVVTQGPIAIRFGATGVGAAAVDANSIMLPAGEHLVQLAITDTHFRVIRAIATDSVLQLEALSAQ